MSKLTWSDFNHLHPGAHLLVGAIPEEESAGGLRQHLGLIARLAALLGKGQYALTINRQGASPEIHCAFEHESDAEKVGDALGAQQRGGLPGWVSRRWFLMDSATCKRVSDVPGKRPKRRADQLPAA